MLAAGALLLAGAPASAADYDFRCTYPPAAARIAPLRVWLDGDCERIRAKTARDAAAARRDAVRSNYPFRRYETQKNWKVVAETPRFLSLSAALYAYSGGAHGTPGSAGLVWDKAARRRIAPIAVFAAPAALSAAVRRDYCARLDALRIARMGGLPVRDDPMGKCPPLGDLTLLLGSTNGKRIDRIGLLADPYVAGSFAEGTYEVTLPVTPAILRAVKPAYRAAFAPAR